jgi:hypothetical protein
VISHVISRSIAIRCARVPSTVEAREHQQSLLMLPHPSVRPAAPSPLRPSERPSVSPPPRPSIYLLMADEETWRTMGPHRRGTPRNGGRALSACPCPLACPSVRPSVRPSAIIVLHLLPYCSLTPVVRNSVALSPGRGRRASLERWIRGELPHRPPPRDRAPNPTHEIACAGRGGRGSR